MSRGKLCPIGAFFAEQIMRFARCDMSEHQVVKRDDLGKSEFVISERVIMRRARDCGISYSRVESPCFHYSLASSQLYPQAFDVIGY